MKRIVVSVFLTVILAASFATFAFASIYDINQDAVLNFLKYEFKTVDEIPDTHKSDFQVDTISDLLFEQVNVNSGWIRDITAGGNLYVSVGTLIFDEGNLCERYIDIKGENGEVRLLSNSFSAGDEYNKTLFWSFKRQEGASIVKGTQGDVRCVVLFELFDGSLYLYDYIDGDGTDFWSMRLPKNNFYKLVD